jgi:DNA-binding transcriptional regulator YhcF (GntR family)
VSTYPTRPEPPSRRVAGVLRQAIADGSLQPGASLPSERALMVRHSIARNTVRAALRSLADEGLISIEHGRGVFVREPMVRPEGMPALRPEAAFLGAGPLTVAVGSKQEHGRSGVRPVVSAETFAAYEALAKAAKSKGLDARHEVVEPSGAVDLNRKNLIVLTSPRILPFIGQLMGADPNLRFVERASEWFLTDSASGEEYHSPEGNRSSDYAYVGRLPRPDGQGTFLYLAGIHANGTLAAARFVADGLVGLYRDVKNRRFSTIISARFNPEDREQIESIERVTPLYKHGR